MLKLSPILLAAALAGFAGPALADDTPAAPTAPVASPAPPAPAMPAIIPKTKGAYQVVPGLTPPLVIPQSSAQACEDERERIKAQATSFCIWVR